MFDPGQQPQSGNLAEATPVGLADEELDAQIAQLSAEIHAATARLNAYVAEVERRKRWADWGTLSCAQYVSYMTGFSPRTARVHAEVAEKLPELPAVAQAFSAGEVSLDQTRALCRAACPETEQDLLNLARSTTAGQLQRITSAYARALAAQQLDHANDLHARRYLHSFFDDDGSWASEAGSPKRTGRVVRKALEAAHDRLYEGTPEASGAGGDRAIPWGSCSEPPSRAARDADALVALAETALSSGFDEASGADRYQLVVHVDYDTLAGSGGERCELEDGPALAPETAQRIACDASLITLLEKDGKPLSLGRKTRKPSRRLRRALKARDQTCRFPGCSRRGHLEAHHVVHWPRGGETAPENLLLLCRAHHRLVHERGFIVEMHPEGPVFKTPEGRLVERPKPERSPTDVERSNRAAGLVVQRAPVMPEGAGGGVDYAYIVDGLMPRPSPREWGSGANEQGLPDAATEIVTWLPPEDLNLVDQAYSGDPVVRRAGPDPPDDG